MSNRIKDVFIGIWRQKEFAIFLLIAFILWYINKLSEQFTADIEIPVNITSDTEKDLWVSNSNFIVKANCETDGKRMISYKLKLIPDMNIPIDKVTVKELSKYEYQIDPKSLLRAMQNHDNNLKINYIEETAFRLTLSEHNSKTLPIKSNIQVTCAENYMSVSENPLLGFDSIEVFAPETVLDTLQFISTEEINYKNLNRSIKANASLIIPQYVHCSKSTVPYNIDIEKSTQYKVESTVELEHLSYKVKTSGKVILPNRVTVFIDVPLDFHFSPDKLHTYVSYDYNSSESKYEVKVKGLPDKCEIIEIIPKYVDIFNDFERRR